MAITHVCTGGCGITAAGAAGVPDQKHWDFGSASGVSVVTDKKPTGTTHAYNFVASAAQTYLRRSIARKIVSGRIYFYMEAFPTGGNTAFIEMICASGNLGCWIIDSAGSSGNTPENIHADVGAGGGQDGPQMTLNTWHYLDFLADTTGSTATMKCRVDGGTEFTASNVQATANMTDIRIGSSNASTSTIWIAAIIFGDAAGDYPFGAGTVEALRPDSDGTHSFTLGDFKYDNSTNIAVAATDVWQKLDDDLQNTTDFVSQNVSRAAGYVEVGFANPASAQAPQAVMASASFHSSGTAANVMGAKLNDGGTTADITDPSPGDGLADVSTTAVQHYSQIFTAAPGGAWTLAKLQGIRARIGFSNDISPIPFCDAIVLEAAFPAAAAAASMSPAAFNPMRRAIVAL